MKHLIPLLLISALAMHGCREGKPAGEQGTGESTSEKPAAEILAEMRPMIAPLREIVAAGKQGTVGIDDSLRQQILTALGHAVEQYGGMTTGRQAFRELSREISGIAVEAANQERWRLVEAGVEIHEILNTDSLLLGRLDKRAESMLARPKIAVKGFLDDKEKGDTYVFLQLMDRKTGKAKTVTVREGEIVDDLRIVEIVGKNNAVRIEYTKIPGLVFEVKGI